MQVARDVAAFFFPLGLLPICWPLLVLIAAVWKAEG